MNDLQSGNIHTRIACVRDLIFSQDSIAHAFKDGTTYKFTIGQLVSGKVNPLEAGFLKLEVWRFKGEDRGAS